MQKPAAQYKTPLHRTRNPFESAALVLITGVRQPRSRDWARCSRLRAVCTAPSRSGQAGRSGPGGSISTGSSPSRQVHICTARNPAVPAAVCTAMTQSVPAARRRGLVGAGKWRSGTSIG
eukprot:1033251-Rhodomonas_salina.1